MRFPLKIFVLAFALFLFACGEEKPATPLETFKSYTRAIKQKDTTTMKLLLSDASLKMHDREAKAQNVNLDDVVKRETLFGADQKSVEYRNERIEGDRATLEVKNSFGAWQTVPFVREENVWKIDKAGFADQMTIEAERNSQKLDEIINQGRRP